MVLSAMRWPFDMVDNEKLIIVDTEPSITADMFESVKKKIRVHPLFQGRPALYCPDASKRRGALATVDHADIRGLVTA